MPDQAKAAIFDPAIAKLRRINRKPPPSARRCTRAGGWMDMNAGFIPTGIQLDRCSPLHEKRVDPDDGRLWTFAGLVNVCHVFGQDRHSTWPSYSMDEIVTFWDTMQVHTCLCRVVCEDTSA